MSFANATDYPDFTEPNQSGSGVLLQGNNAAAGVYGPVFVGNLPSISFYAQTLGASSISLDFQTTQTFNGGVQPASQSYEMTQDVLIWDELKVTAPFMYLVVLGGPATFYASSSFGGKGSPMLSSGAINWFQSSITINAGTGVNYLTNIITPGPMTCCAGCSGGGQPMVRIYDAPGGASINMLGFGEGPAPQQNVSGTVFDFIASANTMRVLLMNIGAANDTTFSVTLSTKRGY